MLSFISFSLLSYPTSYSTQSLESLFKEYQFYNHIYYNSEDESVSAFLAFKANIEQMGLQNIQQVDDIPYYADVHQTQFANRNVLKLNVEEYKLSLSTEDVFSADNYEDSNDLPNEVDWSRYTSHVHNQGICGSCWSFASSGMIESRYNIKHNTDVSLSMQQLIDCSFTDRKYAANQGCMGAAGLKAALFYTIDNGLDSLLDYPYVNSKVPETVPGNHTCRASNYDSVVTPNSFHIHVVESNTESLMAAVASGPVEVAMCADHTIQLYKKGVLPEVVRLCELNHAVLVVGYGVDGSGHKYWKVKNSWSQKYGELGFFRIPRIMSNSPLVGKGADYGVTEVPIFVTFDKPDQQGTNTVNYQQSTTVVPVPMSVPVPNPNTLPSSPTYSCQEQCQTNQFCLLSSRGTYCNTNNNTCYSLVRKVDGSICYYPEEVGCSDDMSLGNKPVLCNDV